MPLWTAADFEKKIVPMNGTMPCRETDQELIERFKKRILELQEGAWPIVRQELEARDREAPPSRKTRRQAQKTRLVPTSYIDTLVAML